MRLVTAFFVLLAMLVAPAHAERRVALVLGNGAYEQVPALANPRSDAEAFAAALRRLGFVVELGLDLDLAGMRQAVQTFARRLEGADVALFYYAGHGMQVHGNNYLLPTDAALETEADLDFAAVPARLVLAQMERWPAVKIVILDACRDNPFAKTLQRSMGASRSNAVSRGLAPIETEGGTLLAYATDPGDVAADGEGSHSPFTEALLRHVETPGVEINTMLARVRADVYTSTGQRQRPWTETSLIGEVYLAPKAPEPPPVTTAMMAPERPEPAPPGSLDPRAIELALWDAAQAGGTAADYEEYLRQYPDGIFARLARIRLQALTAGTMSPGARPDEADGPDKAFGPTGTEPPPATGGPDAVQPGTAERETATAPDPADGGTEPDAGQDDGIVAAVPPTNDRAGSAPARTEAEAGATVGPEEAEAALGLDASDRREVQARLLVAGHDPRGIDGIFGPGTRTALTDWQSAEGLQASGYLDETALKLLERRTETEYAAWVERQRRQAEARRAAERERAARERERRAAEARAAALRSAPAVTTAPAAALPAPVVPAPQPTAPTTARTSTATSEAKEDDRPVRERYEQDCYFVFAGKPQLERRCE